MTQPVSTIVNTFAEKQTMKSLHKMADDDRMQNLFDVLVEEGVVLNVVDETSTARRA